MCVPATLALTACLALGCGNALNRRIVDLEAEHERQVKRLDKINADIERAEREARIARRRAEFELCRADAARLSARIELARSECHRDYAGFERCRAQEEKDAADAAVGGCLVGLLFAPVTAGATLVGCAGGYIVGEAGKGDCEVPACVATVREIPAQVIAESGLPGMPICEAGFYATETTTTARKGLKIVSVIKGTTAARIGLAPGDVIVWINGHWIADSKTLASVLDATDAGEPISVRVVRHGRIYQGTDRFDAQLHDGRRILGFRHDGLAWDVPYVGVQVSKVSPNGPGRPAGLREGDFVVEVEGAVIASVEELQSVLSGRAHGERVQLTISKPDSVRVAVVHVVDWATAERVATGVNTESAATPCMRAHKTFVENTRAAFKAGDKATIYAEADAALLACPTTGYVARQATLAACEAGDFERARRYFAVLQRSNLSDAIKGGVMATCEKHGVALTAR